MYCKNKTGKWRHSKKRATTAACIESWTQLQLAPLRWSGPLIVTLTTSIDIWPHCVYIKTDTVVKTQHLPFILSRTPAVTALNTSSNDFHHTLVQRLKFILAQLCGHRCLHRLPFKCLSNLTAMPHGELHHLWVVALIMWDAPAAQPCQILCSVGSGVNSPSAPVAKWKPFPASRFNIW